MTTQAAIRTCSLPGRGTGADRTVRRHDLTGTRHAGRPVLAIRARASEQDTARFVHDALEELHTFMRDHDLQPAGPPFTIVNRTPRPGTLDIEAGWPIDHPAAGTGRIHHATLPTTLTGHSSHQQHSRNEIRGLPDII
jgi:hypothetical protein